mmetsp:Transcript_25777/g.47114  ORF Transcript_25777/g.47114 Transcript_25777/m.47114 type:complete len:293 (+) Transcript_25777:94-972(+)
MVVVEDVLNEALSQTVKSWFSATFSHPYLDLETLVVPETTAPIPKRWVDEVRIDEGFFRVDDGDLFGEGGDGQGGGHWSPEDGKQRLQEALQRLTLPEEKLAQPQALERMSRTELALEKKRVKQELKRYDAEFRRQFGRLPSHNEKEPMRPLYVYYRRLKSMISQAEQARLGGGGRRYGRGSSEDGMRFGMRESLATIPDSEETPRQRGSRVSSVEDQITQLEARMDSLQTEKSVVRSKLQAFQERFVSENDRKIRFHKDILPIEREYRMYKNLKEEIMKVESQLRDLKAEL